MSDDWWDDLTNNLATDFAPLVALFGESPTKQYLSECLTATDILIFATAPLGVITAVVSAIRVCGTPSLRAFIGRAQEGAGNAEAELCSSTSRNVCELYNNGGIARVFGRPKLLEIIHDSNASLDDFFTHKEGEHPTAGIYSFEEFKKSKDTQQPFEWKEVHGRSNANVQCWKQYILRQEISQQQEMRFAPNPNLSLNVGIKPREKLCFYAAAALGIVLQSAVLVWAALARFRFQLVRHDAQDKYAVPLTVAGTICLDFGVGLCAYLVERSTKERVFVRSSSSDNSTATRDSLPPRPRTRLYWVQPGNQVIGDQVFDSFAYTDFNNPLTKYTTSWKQDELEEGIISTMKLIWAAVLFALLGFVLQFIGLRACHSSVSLAQLSVTVIMSIVRAALRTQRMEKKDNMTKDANLFQGHELDWLALEINRPTGGRTDWCKDCEHLWMVFSGHNSSNLKDYEERFEIEQQKDGSNTMQVHKSLRWGYGGVGCRAPVGLRRIRKDDRMEGHYTQIPGITASHPSYPNQIGNMHQQTLEGSTKSFFHRIRLARMTGLDNFHSSASSKWDQTLVSVRHTAELLANAIEATASILFITDTAPPIEIENRWKDSFVMFCPFDIAVCGCKASDSKDGVSNSFFSLCREEGPSPEDPPAGPWQVDRAELESILGLWTWSLRNTPSYKSQKSKVRSTQLFKESARTELAVWRQRAMKRIRTITLSLEPSNEHYPLVIDLKQLKPQHSLWWNDGKKFVMERRLGKGVEGKFPPNEADDIRHFYGLQHLEKPKVIPARVNALELASTNSLMLACAQELYKMFFDTITHTIRHIGGQTRVNKGRGSFYLANENIDRLYAAFVHSGLGSAEDAFACIIPVLHVQKKLPSVSSALTEAREIAARHIKEGEWEQASNMLEFALESFGSSKSSSSTNVPAEAQNDRRLWVLTLCECYRGSLRDERMRMLEFPYKGISRLLRSEYFSLTKHETPSLYVDPLIFPAPPGHRESVTLARVLLNYAEAMVWISEGLGDTLGANLVIETLAECQISKPERDESRAKYFLEAVQKYDLSSALYFLGSKDITATLQGRTAISYAAERGWFTIVEALTNANADIDAKDEFNRSSVYYAARCGDINTFRYLLHNGASPNIPDKHGRTALDCAADKGHFTIIQELVNDPRVDPNPKDRHGRTPLTRAIRRGASKVVDILLSCGRVDETSQDKERLTDLMLAVDADRMEKVRKYVRRNLVNIRAEDCRGRTVLSRSALQGQKQYFHFLLTFDRSLVQTRDKSGRSPLSLAAGGVEEEDQRAIQLQEDIDNTDSQDETTDFNSESTDEDDSDRDMGKSRKEGESGKEDAKNSQADDKSNQDIDGDNVEAGREGRQTQENPKSPSQLDSKAFTTVSTDILLYKNYHDIIAELMRHPEVNPNEQDDHGKTPIFHAVSNGRAVIVTRLLTMGEIVDPNLSDKDHNSPLAIAIMNKSYGMVASLLTSPTINTSQINESGDSALLLATRLGYESIVKQLLDHENIHYQQENSFHDSEETFAERNSHTEDVLNSQNAEGDTPLIVSCRTGQNSVALLLLKIRSIEINIKGGSGDTALMIAARNGNHAVVSKLLSFKGVKLNEENDDGDTPLLAAIRNSREDVVNDLMQRNDLLVNMKNKHGKTPLETAVENEKSFAVQKLLLHEGLDVNLRDAQGKTALQQAVIRDNVQILRYLLRNDKVEKDIKDEKDNTLLLAAAQAGQRQNVLVLVKSGKLDLQSRNHDGRDLLSYASEHGWEDVASRLLDPDWDNSKSSDTRGRDALSYAAASKQDSLSIVQKLIKKGFNPNCADHDDRTPLSYAAENNCQRVLEYLLSIAGVSSDKSDKTGRTPLSYAAGRHHLHVVNRLLSLQEVDPDSLDNSKTTPLQYAVLAVVPEYGKPTRSIWLRNRSHDIRRDANVIRALLDSRRVDTDRTCSQSKYMPIHIAAAIRYQNAVLALLPWVRPRERLAMRRFLGTTGMVRMWDDVDDREQWVPRGDESEGMNDNAPDIQGDSTSDPLQHERLGLKAPQLKREPRALEALIWAQRVTRNQRKLSQP